MITSWPVAVNVRAACRRFAATVRAFRGQAGNVNAIFGVTLPLLVGGAAYGVETSYWYLKDAQLQTAADAAVFAAAIEKRSGSNATKVLATATDIATGNGYDTSIGTIVVHSPPTSGTHMSADAVEVILTQPVQRFFTGLFSDTPVIEKARAVANFNSLGSACILALNPTAAKAALFSGNTGVNVKGCDVMANSVAIDAIKTQGSSITHAGCFITSGNVNITGGSVTLDCPHSLTNQPAVGDPFASIPEPTAPGSCQNANALILQPGKYCSGLTINNARTMLPGVYYITGGDFKLNANAVVIGTGVTIYLAGSSRVSMNGNSAATLSAPTSGTYAGILFFGDRSNTATTNNTYNGTNASKLTGYLYHKTQPVQYLGNFSGVNGCTRVVADTVEWSGNTTIDDTLNCAAFGLTKTPTTQVVTLVE